MTDLLRRAFEQASKLSPEEQDAIAAMIFDELAALDFDRKIAATSDKLAILARQALAEHKAGLTEPLDLKKF